MGLCMLGVLLLLSSGVFGDTECKCTDQFGIVRYIWFCTTWFMNGDCGPSDCSDFCDPSCHPELSQCHGGLTTGGWFAVVAIVAGVLSLCLRVWARLSNRRGVNPAPPLQQMPPPQQPILHPPPQQQFYQPPAQHFYPQQTAQQPLLSSVDAAPPPYYESVGQVSAPPGSAPPAASSSASSIHTAAHLGDEAKCSQCLAQGIPVDQVSQSGWTPLCLAANAGHEGCVKVFLNARANVHATTPQGHTALHLASLKGFTSICTLLVHAGSNLQAKTAKGSTPLGLAKYGKHDATAQALAAFGAT